MGPRRPVISTQPSFSSDSGAPPPRPPLPPNHQYSQQPHSTTQPPIPQPPLLQAPTSAPPLPPPLLNGAGGMVQGGPGYGPQHPPNVAGGVGLNHPGHPQHQQWLQVQQQQQQRQEEMRIMEMQGGGPGQGQGQRGALGQVGAGQGAMGIRPPPRGDPRNQHELGFNSIQPQQQHNQANFTNNSNQYNIGPQSSASMPLPGQPGAQQAHLRAGSAEGYVPGLGPGPSAGPGPSPMPVNQQRPIPISRNSISGHPSGQQFGQAGIGQSPAQAGPGPYRVLSQGGSAQGRASPAPGRPRSIPGSAGGLNEMTRTPQQLGGGLDRGAGPVHPAVLGAALAASG